MRLLSGLPLDNIIPYNFSRYLVEDIPFDAIDVVPTWSASSRGPLSGSIVALVFVMFSVSEHAAWLATSPVVFFFFQCTLVFLNALVLPATWTLATCLFSRRTAAWSMLALATSSFVFTNFVFTWPKFFMTYYILLVVLLLLADSKRPWSGLYLGVFCAGAYLSHQLSLFYLLPLLLFFFWRAGVGLHDALRGSLPHADVRLWYLKKKLRTPALLLISFSSLLAPWVLLKQSLPPVSSRMQYLHLFCIWDKDVSTLSFFDAFARYLDENSWGRILLMKLRNLIYPFDVFHPGIVFLMFGLSLTVCSLQQRM